jgi:ketosteroid isomerase-like protein
MNHDAVKSCEWLAMAAYSLMDQGQYEATADLFTTDAVWVRGGVPVTGPEAILAALHKRPATDLSRHLVTNVLIQDVDGDTARGTAVFVPLRGAIRDDGTVALGGISAVGDLEFAFRREGGRWKISALTPRIIFKA